MVRPDGIPEDVWKAAWEAIYTAHNEKAAVPAIARAILAERERCAKLVEAYGVRRDVPARFVPPANEDELGYTLPATRVHTRPDPLVLAAAIRKGAQ
jgi:hypothetical protein